MYNLSFTTGIPVQYVIMLDWIQLSSSLDSSSSSFRTTNNKLPIEIMPLLGNLTGKKLIIRRRVISHGLRWS